MREICQILITARCQAVHSCYSRRSGELSDRTGGVNHLCEVKTLKLHMLLLHAFFCPDGFSTLTFCHMDVDRVHKKSEKDGQRGESRRYRKKNSNKKK